MNVDCVDKLDTMELVRQYGQNISYYMQMILSKDFSDERILQLAQDCVNRIDKTDVELIGKGFIWIANNYLVESGIPFKLIPY